MLPVVELFPSPQRRICTFPPYARRTISANRAESRRRGARRDGTGLRGSRCQGREAEG